MNISYPNPLGQSVLRSSTSLVLTIFILTWLLSSCGSSRRNLPPSTKPSTTITPPKAQESDKEKKNKGKHREMRAVWLTTAYGLDWPHTKADTPAGVKRQQAELEKILDRLKSDNFNTIFFQARLSGSTTYPSQTEPFARVFTSSGDAPDYDPLAFAVEACHKRGLAIHAWVVTYPIVSTRKYPHPIVLAHPNWAIAHKGSKHLDPGLPEVRTYIASLASEIARNYQVDGIQFDYFRYPEEAERFNDNYSYRQYGQGQDRDAWRRENLTEQLVEVNDSLQNINPRLLVSVAPLGKLRKIPTLQRNHGWTAYESVHQDPETWAKLGLVDFIAPMMYYKDELFSPFLEDWKRIVGKYVPIVVGLAPYRVDRSEKYPWEASVIRDQIEEIRSLGADGISFFRDEHIRSGRIPEVHRIIKDEFAEEALPIQFPKLKN